MSLLEPFYKHNKRRCPSCLDEIYPGDCKIEAEIPKDALVKAAPKGWRREKERMYPTRLVGPKFAQSLAHRKCPKCGYSLPYNIETARSLNIAVVGGNRAGKTHYIAALIKDIKAGKIATPDQFFIFRCLTSDMLKDYEDKTLNPIFIDLTAQEASKSIFENAPNPLETTHKPLIYELSIRLTRDVLPTSLNLTIYDTAGEDYMVDSRLVQSARYVLNADALIFVADPVSMPKIFKEIRNKFSSTPNLYIGAPKEDPTTAFTSVISQIERFRGKRTGTQLETVPVAIMLSKSDLFEKFRSASNQYYFMQEPAYTGGIDLDDIKKVDSAVRELLNEYDETGLIKASNTLASKSFFATSATGQPPDTSSKFTAIRPSRCLDPVLWILNQLEVIYDADQTMPGY